MSNHVRRILLADEHDLTRRGLRALLEMRPNLRIVAEACTGRAALEEARASAPDIAIVEYVMPELNGVDLTRALKRERPQIDVLIFSRHEREDIVLEALRAGARGFVSKSDPEHCLMAAIDALYVGRPYISGGVSEKMLTRIAGPEHGTAPTLTARERQVVQLIAEGRLTREVAGVLELSAKTVECHRAAVMQKLKIHNTAQLVRYALRNRMIDA